MSRLVAFGSSQTYGHGLEDCHVEPNHHGPEPSKLAWPNILASMLHMDVVNCGIPGASNIHILWKLLNFNFNSDDLCIVMWTHFGRQPFSNLKYDSSIIDWDEYRSNTVWKNRLTKFNLDEERKERKYGLDEEDITIRNYISIHHGYSYLLSKNIRHLFVIGTNDGIVYKKPEIEIPTLNLEISFTRYSLDKALDKSHPGPKTHMYLAKKLFDISHVY